MEKLQVVKELHKQARKNFKRRRTIIKGFDDLWQTDLAEFGPYARENKGYKYILLVIDCFSKYLWTRPLKNKTGPEVTAAMTNIFKEGRIPKNIQSDDGKEYYNQHFQKLMKKHGINHYSTYSTKKAAIVERVIRTLKSKLYKTFSLQGTYKWFDILKDKTLEYNNSKHRTIAMKPALVKPTTKLKVYDNIKIAGKAKYKVGDMVRLSKFKTVFAKGYTPNWTTELFKIDKVQITNPVTYKLVDTRGHPVLGGFYEEELQKAKYSDIYLVEKVLKRKKNKVFVKWLGLDPSHNSWLKKDNVLK